VSPLPPILPDKQLKLVARSEFIFGLFGATSLLAIVLAPLTVAFLGAVFTLEVRIAPPAIAKTVALSVLVPFSLGMLARRKMLKFAAQASSLTNKVGTWLLILALVPVLINQWSAMISLIGNGTVLAFVAFTVVGLAVGHVLGGPDADNRTVLALATASRHPGVALTIATQIYPDQKLVAPALLLYLIVGAITSTPYVMWRRRLTTSNGVIGST
jgi:bile acid:Na+ symporter, BASS family